jgi:hypothetical protein
MSVVKAPLKNGSAKPSRRFQGGGSNV